MPLHECRARRGNLIFAPGSATYSCYYYWLNCRAVCHWMMSKFKAYPSLQTMFAQFDSRNYGFSPLILTLNYVRDAALLLTGIWAPQKSVRQDGCRKLVSVIYRLFIDERNARKSDAERVRTTCLLTKDLCVFTRERAVSETVCLLICRAGNVPHSSYSTVKKRGAPFHYLLQSTLHNGFMHSSYHLHFVRPAMGKIISFSQRPFNFQYALFNRERTFRVRSSFHWHFISWTAMLEFTIAVV